MREVNRIVVHCSATPSRMDIGVDEIRQWHTAKGWSDIGYHLVIRRSGVIETGRPLDQVGAHAKGYNTDSIGICLVGGSDADNVTTSDANFTVEQYCSLYSQVMTLITEYEIETTDVVGHRDLPDVAKACPCFDVQSLLFGGVK